MCIYPSQYNVKIGLTDSFTTTTTTPSKNIQKELIDWLFDGNYQDICWQLVPIALLKWKMDVLYCIQKTFQKRLLRKILMLGLQGREIKKVWLTVNLLCWGSSDGMFWYESKPYQTNLPPFLPPFLFMAVAWVTGELHWERVYRNHL